MKEAIDSIYNLLYDQPHILVKICFQVSARFLGRSVRSLPEINRAIASTDEESALPPFEFILAEDDHQNREVISLQMTHLGLRVTSCANGQEVLDRCWSGDASFDLALLDIKMPGLDGIATARALREHPKTRSLPILFITAGASMEEQAAAWNANPEAVLIKPFTRNQIVAAIEHALRVRGLLREGESIIEPLPAA